ncbi:phosphotransferase [Mycolicibacterium boenickei]
MNSKRLDGSAEHATLLTSSPPISVADATELVKSYYGLAASVMPISGERDSNFRLDTERGAMVLKVIHSGESAEVTDCQTAVLEHVERVAPELPIPRIVRDLHGSAVPVAEFGPAVGRKLRMVTLLPGVALHTVSASVSLRMDIGRVLAEVDLALRTFVHPAASQPTLWDIAQLPNLRPLIDEIENPEKRALLRDLVEAYVAEVATPLSTVRKQPIHNDFSGDNLMADEHGNAVCGVLDFGDLATSQLVVDVAVAAAYQLDDEWDPTRAAADVVNGYHQVSPLTEAERSLLFDLLIARQVTRLTMTEWRAARFRENSTYILRNTPRSWRQLDRLLDVSRSAFEERIHL